MANDKIRKFIELNYYPTIAKREIAQKCRYQINTEELMSMGGPFAAIAAEMAIKMVFDQDNIYLCTSD